MDCRTTLLVGLSLALFGPGCAQMPHMGTATPPQPQARPQPPPPPPPVITKNDEKRPKRPPKASTLVAWAACREGEANSPKMEPTDKEACYEEARRAYQEALKLEPKNQPAYAGLARIYAYTKRYDKAMETYHKALEIFPKDASLWFDLGMCHARLKQWDLAIKSFQKGQQFDPENRAITRTLGFCQARAGQFQESAETFAKIMTPAEAHYNVARMLQHLHKEELSRQFLHQAVHFDPDLEAAKTMLANLEHPPALGSPAPVHVATYNTPAANAPAATSPAASHPIVQINFEDR